ncbi:carbohydrate kinase [Acidobacteria bacterium Mor1]|nr:carbohydrate kinase [Acidobacteria bacterium Mor1]
MSKPLDVVGIGNAIVDVLAQVDDRFLDQNEMAKGRMTLIDGDQAAAIYEQMPDTVESSGGSAANTLVGVASLGGRGAFIGKVRDDKLGEVFTRDIRDVGVEFDTAHAGDGPQTARCLILVTPDAQRTMNTFLGAAAHLSPEDIDPYAISRAAYTYLEGYLWDPPPAKEAFVKAARVAHASDGKVALTLSDSFVVNRHRESFLDLVSNHVDLVFANEDEVQSLFECDFDDAIRQLKGRCEIAAVTRGEKGSLILRGDETVEVAAASVDKVVDTTGAGDLYAAGFLFGLSRGYGLGECGKLGGIAAGEVISHMGARPLTSLADLAAEVLGAKG